MKHLKTALCSFLMLVGFVRVNGQDTGNTAKVYFVRHTGYNGAALAFHCFIDSSRVCDLKNNRFSVHEITAGTRKINVTVYTRELRTAKNAKNTISLNAVAGQVYYIRILPEKSYSIETSLKALAVTETTIRPTLAKCSEETNCLK